MIKKAKEVDCVDKVCYEFVYRFAVKQDLDFDGWLCDDVGGVAMFGGMYMFQIADIIHDIRSNQPPGRIMDWMCFCIVNIDNPPTYESYINSL